MPPRRPAALLRRLARTVAPALLALALLTPGGARAAESTSVAGDVLGLEICPQIWCGAAIFVGRFDGALDGTAGEGRWWVAVTHNELPMYAGNSTAITGGEWGMVVGDRSLRGRVDAGTITYNGDGTFTVRPALDVVEGGEGRLSLAILLDHNPFPPAVRGAVAPGDVLVPAPLRQRAPDAPDAPVAPASAAARHRGEWT